MCSMTGSAHLSTWVHAETKQRFASAAARQGLSESALLKRLVEQMLSASSEEAVAPVVPVDPRDARVTVRLVPEDRALLRERAAARTMPAATYVSVLVRAHLRQLPPLPNQELSALRSTVNELAALGRNLNTMARLLKQDGRAVVPGRNEVLSMVKICEVLRDRFRDLIKANLLSWEVGHAEKAH
jgi:predicted DNA binding CopG/RHH family protein